MFKGIGYETRFVTFLNIVNNLVIDDTIYENNQIIDDTVYKKT